MWQEYTQAKNPSSEVIVTAQAGRTKLHLAQEAGLGPLRAGWQRRSLASLRAGWQRQSLASLRAKSGEVRVCEEKSDCKKKSDRVR